MFYIYGYTDRGFVFGGGWLDPVNPKGSKNTEIIIVPLADNFA